MEQAARLTILRTYQQPLAVPARPVVMSTILQRLNAKEKDAVSDCINEYGNKVWFFSKQHMPSLKGAKELSEEIFKDIWIYADKNGGNVRSSENRIIENISIRRLFKHRWQAIKQF